jgi:hypothetical protein
MRFEARELKPYAEPVQATDLQPGRVYFSVQFVDEDMLMPVLEPLEFVGANIHQGDVGQLYFRAVTASAFQLVDRADNLDKVRLYRAGNSEINHIFEYERALDRLLACALRRRARNEPR